MNHVTTDEKSSIIIVLGQKLREEQDGKFSMEISLIDRVELANRVYCSLEQKKDRCQEQLAFILLSGKGQFGVESILMSEYLKKAYKYSDKTLLMDENSMTTVENAIFSLFMIWNIFEKSKTSKPRCISLHVITSDFHKERSKIIFDTILQKVQKLFKNITFDDIIYHGSITQHQEPKELVQKSKIELDKFYSNDFNWKTFAQQRNIPSDEIDNFLEFTSQLYC